MSYAKKLYFSEFRACKIIFSNEALMKEVQSGICPSLEYASKKSCLLPNKSIQTSVVTNCGAIMCQTRESQSKEGTTCKIDLKRPILVRGKTWHW